MPLPSNSNRIGRFAAVVTRQWLRVIRRRSQHGRQGWTWTRFTRWVQRYLPAPHVRHPYPYERFYAKLKAGAV